MFTSIILPALKRTWQAKATWYIAIFTLTPLTIINEWNLIIRIISGVLNPENYFWYLEGVLIAGFFAGVDPSNILSTAAESPVGITSLVIALIFALTLFFFFSWVIMNAQAIVIYRQSPDHADKKLTLQEALAKVEKLWVPLLQLNLSLVLVRILLISLLLVTGALLTGGFVWLQWILMAIILIVVTLFSFTIRLTLFKTVLEHRSIREGFKESMQTVKKHMASMYELSFTIYLLIVITAFLLLFILGSIFTEFQLGVTILSVFVLDGGPVPFIVLFILLALGATIGGFIALFTYTSWLTWYTEMTRTGVTHAFTHRLVNLIRSNVKRAKVN